MNPTAAVTDQAEAATLGAILLQPQVIAQVSWLRSGDFADPGTPASTTSWANTRLPR